MLLSDLAEVPVQAAGSLSLLACDPAETRGRRHPEPAAPTRNAFQRDRDRIVHSTAFRRLVYKTQVFLNHEGDLFRTRLTHSLEVAQLGRSIARSLGLNEDLVEAVALAHDLGHTPFGHVGQDVLNDCMKDFGGFEHNLQSLRVIDELEERYLPFNGLNLTFETREGVLKHCSRRNAELLEAGLELPQGLRDAATQDWTPAIDALRDWGHAKDFVEMQWLMLQQEQPEDFVIATGVQYSVRDFVNEAAQELGVHIRWEGQGVDEKGFDAKGNCIVSVDPRYFRPTEVETLLGDATKAKQKLGWAPKISFQELVQEMVREDLKSAERDELVKQHGYYANDYHE